MTSSNVPVPAWTNPPLQAQYFAPSYFQITNIQLGQTTQITVAPTFDHDCNFVVGQQVLFSIPNAYGTIQLNGMTGIVLSLIGTLDFVVNIVSTAFTPFVPSPTGEHQIAQVIPAGTFRTGNINSNLRNFGLTIPGSFTNTSPFVV